jgi:hypothetical protein
MGLFLCQIRFPSLSVPQFQVIAHAKQNDLVSQPGQGNQAIRQEDTPSAVEAQPCRARIGT